MYPLRNLFLLLFIFVVTPLWLQGAVQYKYSVIPKKVYENQLFPVTILEIGSDPGYPPDFYFDLHNPHQPLFQKPLVIKNGNDSFYTFYFKADRESFELPRLTITNNGAIVSFDAMPIPTVNLKGRADFCGVLAADMKIKTSQASTYDEKSNLVTLSIEAFEANIENMHLDNAIEDGVENIERTNAKVIGEFYIVVPDSQKKLKFTYYNTIKQQYNFLETPIEIVDSTVSTQSQLNPKNDGFDKFKKFTFIGLSILFFLLFLWKRDFFYLIISVISMITLLTFYSPKKKICIQQGASLYILPTNTSRISTKMTEEYTTQILAERTEFYKIELPNGAIGWIKNEDICEN